MFEFHGWLTLRVDDQDDPDMEVNDQRLEEAAERLKVAIKGAEDGFSLFEIRRLGNGLTILVAHGLRNHRFEPAIDLFRWVARELPFSYGLLYVHDDEDTRGGGDFTNEFRVWRVARGQVEELADTLLSPFTPTCEESWEDFEARLREARRSG